MSARHSSFLLHMLRSGFLAASLTLLPPLVATAHAGMIGTGLAPRAVAIGDVDEDGYADLVSGNLSDSTVSISFGRGNGRFKQKVQYSCGSSVYGIALADLNGDNHLDVVSCCQNINTVGVRFGVGDGTLGARTDYSVNSPTAVVARDLSEDGLPDLAIASTTFPYLTVMHATGPGIYGPQATYPGASSTGLAVGDLNNDGDLDVVIATSSGIYVFLSSIMPGVYGFPVNYTMQGISSGVVLADLNHDGALDVAAAIQNFNNVNVRLGIGDGTFGASNAYATGASPFGIVSADFNGDTHPDLAVTANSANTVSVLLGTGSGSFQPKVDHAAGVSPLGIAVGQWDYGVEPYLDLAVAASGSNSLCTLPGNGDGTFQVPSGPVYVWAPASGTAFDPNNWLPTRGSSTTSDILVFNRGGVVSVSSVPTATIGQLVVSGGTEASFSGFLGSATLTVAGGSGDDAVVEEGSKAVLASAGSPVSVNLAGGAYGMIYGDVEIRGGASRFQALDEDHIIFWSTGRAIIGPGSSTTPFGNGTGASGQASVLFHYGSQYIAQAPVAVFGASYPFSVIDFWPGSRFRMDVAFNPDVSGRRYADFEYNVPGGSSAFTGSSPLILDSLIVSQGTLSVEITAGISIHGNIVVPACGGPNRLLFAPSTPTTYQLGGISRQYLYSPIPCPGNLWRVYSSPNVTWDIDNPAGVEFSQAWRTTSNIHFAHGTINSTFDPVNFWGWQVIVDSTATISGASQSTGWFVCPLVRRVTASGVLQFDVGDSANYLPVGVGVNGVTAPGYMQAATAFRDHPDIGSAQLDMAHLVHRVWMLVAHNDFGGFQAPTYFGDLVATFPFLTSDLSPGSDPMQFVLRKRQALPPWEATSFGGQSLNAIGAYGLLPSGLRTSLFAAGQPITPSLSVFNASEAEGNGAPAPGGEPASSPTTQASLAQPADLASADGAEIVAPFRGMSELSRPSSVDARPMEVQSAGSLSFRVRLSQAAVVPISVDYETVDGSATAADGDYTPTSGTLNFAPGDTALDIVVSFGVDATPEPNETFGITISNATNATIDTPTATGTILDDDDLIAPTAQVTYPNGGEVIHQNQQVNLLWTAGDNVGVSGVDIQVVAGASVTTLASNYPNTGSYLWSASGPASTKMRFRVVAHDDHGNTTTDNSNANWELSPYTIGVEDDVPLAFALPAPSPNPSPAGSNRITFAVPHEAQVRLTVHDVRGRTLATLANGTVPAGRHTRIWDSAPVGAGVYFLHFEAPGFRADQRVVVVR